MARIVRRTLLEPKAYIIDGKEQWLCQCGLSQNQPFCDSSHTRNGFTTNDQPTVCEASDDEGVA